MARRGGFPGMGGGMNMQSMMAQAQRMQANMQKAQEEFEALEFSATAGGGVVKAVVNGQKKLVSIEIDEAVVDPDDIETLQDLVVAAVNEALSTASAEHEKVMSKATGGMNLGGMF